MYGKKKVFSKIDVEHGWLCFTAGNISFSQFSFVAQLINLVLW